MKHYDIVVVGAGPVGVSLALALQGNGLRIVIVERTPLQETRATAGDDKALALSEPSVRVLQSLNVWPAVKSHAAPINRIHISQRGHFGVTRIAARDLDLPYLGQVVPAKVLASALAQRATTAADIELVCPASVTSIEHSGALQSLRLEGEIGGVTARLVVGADGAQSIVRRLLSIDCVTEDYNQHALTVNLTPELTHHGVAYERFTGAGPVAVLPLVDGRIGLVWAGKPAMIETLSRLSEEQFLERVHDVFGRRLGHFRNPGARKIYPLRASFATQIVQPGAVLIGNAAQTLHPVAAQGFNLGLRDVTTLADMLLNAHRNGLALSDTSLLEDYEQARAQDRIRTRRFTDGIAQSFLGDIGFVSQLRGFGLLALDLAPPLKRAFMRRAMGS